MTLRRARSVMHVAMIAYATACGSSPSTGDAGAADASLEACTAPADCDDSLYCTGVERCAPDDTMADARGCVRGAPPCAADDTCHEDSGRCEADDCADADGDSYRDAACGGMDCDDGDPLINPGATEVCDADDTDEDCDPNTFGPRDGDDDGYLDALCCNENAVGAHTCGDDCDDDDAAAHPNQPDICGDGVDNDCDTEVDEGGTLYLDLDNDGRGDPATARTSVCMAGLVANADDCDDARNETYGGPVPAREMCDGRDNDCGNTADPGGAEPGEDMDGDGHSLPSAMCLGRGDPGALASSFPRDDCDDGDAQSHPGAFDLCGDGVDQNCDGVSDNLSQRVCTDMDGDGHGDVDTVTTTDACVLPAGTVPFGVCDDCDDRNSASYPGNREICDRIDNDCSNDGGTDVSEDLDGDGFAPTGTGCATFNPSDPETAMALPGADCNDSDIRVNPGIDEVCDGFDFDCSGGGGVAFDEDADRDGHSPIDSRCLGAGEAPGAFAKDDCDDSEPLRHGGLSAADDAGACDGIDNDCDLSTSELSAPCADGGYCGGGGICVRAREVRQIAVGDHSCALLGDGTVECWGNNEWGQTSTAMYRQLNPAPVAGLDSAVEITVGGSHTCARLRDGTVECWGRNHRGQLGDGGRGGTRRLPAPVRSLNGVVRLGAGGEHTCAATADGGVSCWGSGGLGQLGQGTTLLHASATVVPGLSGVTRVATGDNHTCVRHTDGSAHCFGDNSTGQLGDGTAMLRLVPTPVVGLMSAIDIASSRHSCTRLSDGTIQCWGNNGLGQLGDGTMLSRLTPTTVLGLGAATDLAVGNQHTCALLEDQSVRCWGRNASGQLGDGTNLDRVSPTLVPSLDDVRLLGVGDGQSCAVAADSTVRCWGRNGYGSLGDGTTTDRSTPTTIPSLSAVNGLFIGLAGHACVRLGDGSGVCWGSNGNGQIGDGTLTDRSEPIAIAGLDDIADYALGAKHTCVLLGDGTVYCMGDNLNGQIGDGTRRQRPTPTLVPGLSTVVEIVAGGRHTCARLADTTVRCWGYNNRGQLGDGTTNSDPALGIRTVPGLSGVEELAAGTFSTCARLTDDTVRCWGSNRSGELGVGDMLDRSSPTEVAGLTGVIGLAGGGFHTCARLSDESVQCWGENNSGNLGDGSAPTDRAVPGPVTGLANVIALDAGFTHTCALLRDGTVRCWGANSRGQLGDRTTDDRDVPVAVTDLDDVYEIRSGNGFNCAAQRDGALRCWGVGDRGQLGNGSLADSLEPTTVWSL